MAKKIKKEKEVTVFSKIWRAISDFFYGISVKLSKPSTTKGTINRNYKQKRTRELIFYFSIVTIPLIQYFIFYVGVNFNSILLAFKQYKVIDGVQTYKFIGLDNFVKFFNDFFNGTDLKMLTRNSFVVYLFSLLIIMPFSLIFSFYIYKKYFMSEFFRVLLYLPSIISSVVTVFMYKYMIDVGLPAFGKLFGLEIVPPLTDPENIKAAILFFLFLCGFGMNTIMYSGAMARIPISVVEYAQLDGVSPFREFFSITLPLIYSTISTFLIVGIAAFFTNQAYLFEMFAKEASIEVQTFGYYLFRLTYAGESQYPYAAAGGIIFTIIAVPITYLLKFILDKFDPCVSY